MKGTCREAVQFDWQDGEFMDFLLGGLPVINKEGLREQVQVKQVQDKYYRLEKAYQTYSFFSTDRERFYSDIKELVNDVKQDVPYWYGLNLASVEDVLNMHKCCLISGEGGIGKSYFIKCFEQELEKRGIKHLCLYGKFLKDIEDIDFDEMKEFGEREEASLILRDKTFFTTATLLVWISLGDRSSQVNSNAEFAFHALRIYL